MSPDRELLLACCRAHWRPEKAQRPVRRDVDWRRFLGNAQRLGVAGLVHGTWTRFMDPARAPRAVQPRLNQVYYQQAIRNAQLATSLQQVLGVFSRQGVAAIVLKGPAIAELVYGNIALRRMIDIDVLVRPEDLDLAERLVRKLGYIPDASSHPVEWYRRSHHHLVPFRAPDGSSLLEVHHHIFPPSAGVAISMEGLWARAQPAQLGSTRALVLAPADLLLHLCIGLSAVEQFWGGLRTLCDIAAVIRRYDTEMDWAGLLTSTCSYGLEKHVYYGLWLARSLIAADVPGHVMEKLQHSARGLWLEELALKSLIRAAALRYRGDASLVPGGLLVGVLAELLATKRGSAKVGGLLRLVYRGFRRLGHLSRNVVALPRPADELEGQAIDRPLSSPG